MDPQIVAGYTKLILAIVWHKDGDEDLLPLRDGDIETIQNKLNWLEFEFPDRAYKEILTMRFDLDGKGTRTLKAIGQQLGVSSECVRQKQIKALRFLRHPQRGWQMSKLFRSVLERRIDDLEDENERLRAELAKEMKHRMSESMKNRFGDVSPAHISIFDFELSPRLENCLRNNNVDTLGKVLQRTERDFLLLKNFGRRTLNELKEILSEYGLSLARAE